MSEEDISDKEEGVSCTTSFESSDSKKCKLQESLPVSGHSDADLTESSDDSNFTTESNNGRMQTDEFFENSASSGKQSPQVLLRNWALSHEITHSALKELLDILRSNYDDTLPVDPRTLCKTPVGLSHHIEKLGGGDYYHFGLRYVIQQFLENSPGSVISSLQSEIQFNVNCDGIPLHKSSSKQFWPILIQFCSETKSLSDPYVVGIFYGNSKPNGIHGYLKKFIEELEELQNGYEYLGTTYFIKVRCFICDAPARQFLKCIISHNGHSGCERCSQHGKYMQSMTFPEHDASLRTDADLLTVTDTSHQKAISPLSALRIGMVTQFVLDPMHLLYLGVMRKLFNLWLKGPLPVRIGSNSKQLISEKLQDLSPYMPREFCRKLRSLDDLDRYKATELRTFLLYSGPVCLKNNVHHNIYRNFLLLSAAVTLLSQNNARENAERARQLLKAFVNHFSEMYGPKYLVYNVHNLIHLPDDVIRYGSLETFSAFPFENHLGLIKRLLRKPNFALSQVINRITERNSLTVQPSKMKFPVLKQQHALGPLLNESPNQQYKELILENFCIRTNVSDQGVMVNNHIGRVQNIVKYENDLVIVYKEYRKHTDLYKYPVLSGTLGIFAVSNLSDILKSCSVTKIQSKYILLPGRYDTAAFPLLHTADHRQ